MQSAILAGNLGTSEHFSPLFITARPLGLGAKREFCRLPVPPPARCGGAGGNDNSARARFAIWERRAAGHSPDIQEPHDAFARGLPVVRQGFTSLS